VASGADSTFTLQVGHGPFRQRSLIPLSRILRFEAVGPDESRVNLRSRLQLGGRMSDGAVDFGARGTYILVLQTDARAYSLLPAIRFNDYLRYEGLTPALDYRERTHRMAMDGSESYSRQAKALIQVGSLSAPQPDRNGEAEFVTPPSGTWLLNVIWTKVAPRASDTDFETVFSSLSFGFPGR
jgi:hypothetical protein